MRLDVFLKKTCIVKTRTQAKTMCEKGSILLNGKKSKPSKDVREGDIIIYNNKNIKIIKIPAGNINKKKAEEYYKVISDKDSFQQPMEENMGL